MWNRVSRLSSVEAGMNFESQAWDSSWMAGRWRWDFGSLLELEAAVVRDLRAVAVASKLAEVRWSLSILEESFGD